MNSDCRSRRRFVLGVLIGVSLWLAGPVGAAEPARDRTLRASLPGNVEITLEAISTVTAPESPPLPPFGTPAPRVQPVFWTPDGEILPEAARPKLQHPDQVRQGPPPQSVFPRLGGREEGPAIDWTGKTQANVAWPRFVVRVPAGLELLRAETATASHFYHWPDGSAPGRYVIGGPADCPKATDRLRLAVAEKWVTVAESRRPEQGDNQTWKLFGPTIYGPLMRASDNNGAWMDVRFGFPRTFYDPPHSRIVGVDSTGTEHFLNAPQDSRNRRSRIGFQAVPLEKRHNVQIQVRQEYYVDFIDVVLARGQKSQPRVDVTPLSWAAAAREQVRTEVATLPQQVDVYVAGDGVRECTHYKMPTARISFDGLVKLGESQLADPGTRDEREIEVLPLLLLADSDVDVNGHSHELDVVSDLLFNRPATSEELQRILYGQQAPLLIVWAGTQDKYEQLEYAIGDVLYSSHRRVPDDPPGGLFPLPAGYVIPSIPYDTPQAARDRNELVQLGLRLAKAVTSADQADFVDCLAPELQKNPATRLRWLHEEHRKGQNLYILHSIHTHGDQAVILPIYQVEEPETAHGYSRTLERCLAYHAVRRDGEWKLDQITYKNMAGIIEGYCDLFSSTTDEARLGRAAIPVSAQLPIVLPTLGAAQPAALTQRAVPVPAGTAKPIAAAPGIAAVPAAPLPLPGKTRVLITGEQGTFAQIDLDPDATITELLAAARVDLGKLKDSPGYDVTLLTLDPWRERFPYFQFGGMRDGFKAQLNQTDFPFASSTISFLFFKTVGHNVLWVGDPDREAELNMCLQPLQGNDPFDPAFDDLPQVADDTALKFVDRIYEALQAGKLAADLLDRRVPAADRQAWTKLVKEVGKRRYRRAFPIIRGDTLHAFVVSMKRRQPFDIFHLTASRHEDHWKLTGLRHVSVDEMVVTACRLFAKSPAVPRE